MFARAGFLFCLVLFAGGSAAAQTDGVFAYRYRLTVGIEVENKQHTNSSVIEIAFRSQPSGTPGGPFAIRVRGEAVLIALDDGRAVVASLRDITWLGARAFGSNSVAQDIPKLPSLSGRRNLAADNMPQFIYFSDMNNPATAQLVPRNDTRTVLGDGAKIVAASVEITKEPVSIDVDKQLPWLPSLRNKLVAPRHGEFQISYGQFIRNDP